MAGREDGLHTLGRWTADRAVATPDRVAIDDRGVVLSYASLEQRSAALALALGAAGYGAGERIASLTGNSADHVVLFFACAKAGLVLVPLSWRLSPRELAEQLRTSDPGLLVVEDEFVALAAAALESTATEIAVGAFGLAGIEASVPPSTGESGAVRVVHDDDPLLMIFTSGTSDTAKAVVLSHANCFWTNLSLSRTAEITSHDVVLAVLPQYHVGGWNIQPLLAWWMGATVVLERTFDAGRVLHLLADRGITTMMGVPANYQLLAEHPDFDTADLSSLRHAIVGGAPMPERLLRTWHGRDVALMQGYGLTEASPNVLCLSDEDARSRVGLAGRPYPHVEVELVDPHTGERVRGEGTGELVVRGPGVFAGYFREPAQTAAALRDGWLHTGDLATRDRDGYFRIVDRLHDVFRSGGESIAPAEVERVLGGHPDIVDLAVAGVPDEHWGEVGVAWLVLAPTADPSTIERSVAEFAAPLLARFKLPRHLVPVDAIPRSATGKVLRRELRARWADAANERTEAS